MSRIALTEIIFKNSSPLSLDRGAEVKIYERGTKTLATLFAAESGATTITQPLSTDTGGRPEKEGVRPWLEPGSYDLEVGGEAVPLEATAGADVAVIKEGPLNVEYPEYGADGTGNADSIGAFEKALAAMPAAGGEILAPRRYKLSKGLNLDWPKHSVTIRGENALHAGSSSRSMFIFTQGGEESLISARSGLGIVLTDIGVLPNNEAWSGKALDFGSDGTHGQNTYSNLERVNLISASQKGTALSIDNTAALVVENCRIGGFDIGVKGEAKEADNSIGITFIGGLMLANKTMNVVNCGESWTFLGTDVECLLSGAAGFINIESGIAPRNLGLYGVWCGDGNGTGTWITWRGIGLQLMNGTLGGGAIGLSLPDTEAAKTNMIEVKGTRFVGTDGIRANWAGGSAFDYDFNPCNWVGNSGKKVSLDNGATDLGSGRIIGGSSLTLGGDIKMTREGAGVLGFNSQLRVLGASGTVAVLIRKLADESARLRILEDGKIEIGGGTGATLDTNLYRNAANQLKTDDQLVIVDGVSTKTVAGVVSDGSFTATPPSGTLAVDTTNSKLYVRVGATWKSVAVA